MVIKEMIFGIIGGLGLFLFGMRLMSDGLKKVAGQKLKKLLGSLTKHRVVAVLVGALGSYKTFMCTNSCHETSCFGQSRTNFAHQGAG